jgi:hypothetical protein
MIIENNKHLFNKKIIIKISITHKVVFQEMKVDTV